MAPRRRTGRRTAALAGALSAVVVIVLLATSWKAIEMRWHLYRLRAEAGYLPAIAGFPEDSARGLAVSEFVRSPEGRKELLRTLLDRVCTRRGPSEYLPHTPIGYIAFGAEGSKVSWCFRTPPGVTGPQANMASSSFAPDESLRCLYRLLPALHGPGITLEEFPGRLFKLLRPEEVIDLPTLWYPRPEERGPACVVIGPGMMGTFPFLAVNAQAEDPRLRESSARALEVLRGWEEEWSRECGGERPPPAGR